VYIIYIYSFAFQACDLYVIFHLLDISVKFRDRNLKFGMQVDYYEYYSKHAKLGDKRGVA